MAMSGIATDGGLWDRIHGDYVRARRARILAARLRWLDTFTRLDLTLCSWEGWMGLYPWQAGLVFERSMHFIAAVVKP